MSAAATSVTTAAARDALPVGHVVRSASGTIACRATEALGVVFGDARTFPWVDLALPLTVLYPAPVSPFDFALSTYLRERDLLVAAADALAYAIAPAEVIGEHVGDNDPWENAREALADERRQHDADVARLEGVVAQQGAMFDGFIRSLAIANGRSDDAERTAWGLPTTGEAS